MAIHILGIRHHGPGSARNVQRFLQSVKPDIVLVEGPPEADPILKWVGHAELKPPVAILCYRQDAPQQSVFYPFAEFSPEWQAILYAQTQPIPVRFIDLPISHQFALESPAEPAQPSRQAESLESAVADNNPGRRPTVADLATAAGFDNHEKWWEHMFENRSSNEPVFDAVAEAMQALREVPQPEEDRPEKCREAYMRRSIRQAEREMFQNIAVICGAWHAPALSNMPPRKEDDELLKNLPKVKTDTTWIPWTYQRLSFASGYGAGISSPGWYDHIWHYPEDNGIRWMARVANLFRDQQMDTSVAHVMEAVRLAGALAALRGLPKAGLEELNEATLSVLCNGEDILLSLIQKKLIVSDRIGETPTEIPKPPLQMDIEKLQKKLRLPPAADWKDYTLDLRKDTDLERSIFLHRLQMIGINWGQQQTASGKGTFKEQWRLQWDPGFSIDIIEKGSYGNTLEEASNAFVIRQAEASTSLGEVTQLLENALPAELSRAIDTLILRVNNLAAASGDILQLMKALPSLAGISRYGNVRKTDAEQVLSIVDSMVTRICISLPAASTGIDEEAAANLKNLITAINESLNILQDQLLTQQWQQSISAIAHSTQSAPLIAGYCTRLLSDHQLLTGQDLVKVFYYAMSTSTAPADAAAWLEGFLTGSGSLLLVDEDLWGVVNSWMGGLEPATFTDILPLLRRSFSHLSPPERRRLGEKARTGGGSAILATSETDIDPARGRMGIPVVLQLLGLNPKISVKNG
ncbi:MAG: hypothetical protein BGO55_13320 [Sphingobacteriales bacterium 50-39]|nr:hypothetical protein [Sphingobacteriales bacterium]OJW57279.1 MAG: hypothetical protein BGO55_13320 [Sphingobacteriales bacterium 50-39]